MALVTIERSDSDILLETDDATDESEEIGELHSIISPARSANKRLVRQGSVSENFFAVKGAALILPKQTSISTANLQIVKKFGGELQRHLRAIFQHLRAQDNIKLAVRLESWHESHRRYLVIIGTQGRQDTDECIIVGCDFATKESTTCTIGMVLPIWCDTNIKLDGDGGFQVVCRSRNHVFKPVSVQAMWSALQSLNRCVDIARRYNYFEGSLYLTWTCFYQSRIKSDRVHINEWDYVDDVYSKKPNYVDPSVVDPVRLSVELLIRSKLKQVMMQLDLDNTTCKEVRVALEGVVDLNLTEYKQYIDNEMLTVLGQMDCASKITDYLYLGSEWNASNIEELTELGVTHILNVTMEIDNFFPDVFTYKNIRLYDVEESELLPHWNHTWQFITDARKNDGKCLVHCRMGISRSAATVSAFLMKTNNWSRDVALKYVNDCRSITDPNPGFRAQLSEYEGILLASGQRHNKLFRSRSESSLSEPSTNDDVLMSPHSTAPLFVVVPDEDHSSVALDANFDFNRHLLDIATLSIPKESRPKSWSPDEGHTCYVPDSFNNDLSNLINNNQDLDIKANNKRNTSEPGDVLISLSTDNERVMRAQQLRKSFTSHRANLRKQAGLEKTDLNLDELAHSEDSVFVHDGTLCNATKKKRSSSPAILTSINTNTDDKVNVDMVSLKSRFSETIQQKSETDGTPELLKATIPVKEIIAVIESPIGNSAALSSEDTNPIEKYTKGHQKTISLPPVINTEIQDDQSTYARNRSFSETQAKLLSVKKIVTQIENRYSQDGMIEEPETSVNVQRTMSMPSRRKYFSPNSSFVPVHEVENKNLNFLTEDFTKINAESNNNNNNNNGNTFADVHIDPESSNAKQNNSIQSPLNQETLYLLREVGSCYSSPPQSIDSDTSLAAVPHFKQVTTHKHKRGLVRNMAREIENGVRKLANKSFQKTKKAAMDSTINQLLMGKSPAVKRSFAVESYTSADCRLVSKFDLPDAANPQNISLIEHSRAPDIVTLLSPTPYRTYDKERGKSNILFSSATRLKIGINRVRRSQSERIYGPTKASLLRFSGRDFEEIKACPVRFQSEPRLNDSESGDFQDSFNHNSRLVKDMIYNFEKRSSIHRSSSLPSSSYKLASQRFPSNKRSLSRSESTPLLRRVPRKPAQQ